ncbi:MAG TPA: VOC family protein [Phenylobacterium sp.]
MELGWFELSLPVADVERSAAFYAELGFQEVDRMERVVTVQKGDCRLALYQGYLEPDRPQLIFWQGDVSAIASALEGRGLKVERPQGPGGETGAMLIDPDGHPVYFVNIAGVTRKEPPASPSPA